MAPNVSPEREEEEEICKVKSGSRRWKEGIGGPDKCPSSRVSLARLPRLKVFERPRKNEKPNRVSRLRKVKGRRRHTRKGTRKEKIPRALFMSKSDGA